MTEREGEICEVCGYPVASPGAALCGHCHEKVHQKKAAA